MLFLICMCVSVLIYYFAKYHETTSLGRRHLVLGDGQKSQSVKAFTGKRLLKARQTACPGHQVGYDQISAAHGSLSARAGLITAAREMGQGRVGGAAFPSHSALHCTHFSNNSRKETLSPISIPSFSGRQ